MIKIYCDCFSTSNLQLTNPNLSYQVVVKTNQPTALITLFISVKSSMRSPQCALKVVENVIEVSTLSDMIITDITRTLAPKAFF